MGNRMRNELTLELRALTPLWTGDASMKGTRVRETGIIGSLRWWYEAIIRGLGRYACDPTSGACVHEGDTESKDVCLTCQLFGCTGFSRRFRLAVDAQAGAGDPVEVKLRNSANKAHRGWRIPTSLPAALRLTITSLHPDGLTAFDIAAIRHTLRLLEHYGALGAKTSQGQGAVRLESLDPPPEADAHKWIKDVGERPARLATILPPHPICVISLAPPWCSIPRLRRNKTGGIGFLWTG